MSNKFEKLLDYLVNEEHEKANELFHEIVVEKSRSIYENLIAEEAEDDEEMDESREEDDEEMDESMMDDESMYEIGGDASDDMVGDVSDDSMGHMDNGMDDMHDLGDEPGLGTELGDDGTEQNLLDKLDQLEAKLDAIIAGEKHEEEENPDIHGHEMDDLTTSDDEESDDMDSEDDDEEMDDEEMDDEEMDEHLVREYREIVRKGKDYTAGSPGEEGSVHKKSAINTNLSSLPSSKANAKNIAQSNSGEGKMDGEKTNMGPNAKSLAGGVKGKFTDSATLNVDGKETKGYDKSTKKPSKEKSVNSKDVLPK